MGRDRTARKRIRQVLSSGPVVDPSGYATGELKNLVKYEGSSVAFIQLIAAMERDDEIVREIRGKRTYGITASSSLGKSGERDDSLPAHDSSIEGLTVLTVDYTVLARAIVREFLAVETDPAPTRNHPDDYARRIDEARRSLERLMSEAARVNTE